MNRLAILNLDDTNKECFEHIIHLLYLLPQKIKKKSLKSNFSKLFQQINHQMIIFLANVISLNAVAFLLIISQTLQYLRKKRNF